MRIGFNSSSDDRDKDEKELVGPLFDSNRSSEKYRKCIEVVGEAHRLNSTQTLLERLAGYYYTPIIASGGSGGIYKALLEALVTLLWHRQWLLRPYMMQNLHTVAGCEMISSCQIHIYRQILTGLKHTQHTHSHMHTHT